MSEVKKYRASIVVVPHSPGFREVTSIEEVVRGTDYDKATDEVTRLRAMIVDFFEANSPAEYDKAFWAMKDEAFKLRTAINALKENGITAAQGANA